MKKKALIIFIFIIFFSFAFKVSASELCSTNGYTILTINGVFTDENGARQNKVELAKGLPPSYGNQPLKVDYIYNPSHLAGVADLIDAVQQGVFLQKEDYDLVEILNDASQKVTTEKLLLVAHSQGNFYSNNFYEKVASQPGGIPAKSIGVYGVATPASYVAGGGKYITSSTDAVINKTRLGNVLSVLAANVDIDLKNDIGSNGHSFSDIYLKYQGDRIVSEIKESLSKLKENDIQKIDEPCISPPKLSLWHKMAGVTLAVADPVAIGAKERIVGVYDTGAYLVNGIKKIGIVLGGAFSGLSANVIASLPDPDSVMVTTPSATDTGENNSPANDLPQEEVLEVAQEEAPPLVIEKVDDTSPIAEPIPDPNNIDNKNQSDATPPEIKNETEEITPDPYANLLPGVGGVVAPVEPESPPPAPVEIPPPPPSPPALITTTIDTNTTLSPGEYNYENLVITNNATLTLEGDPTSTNDFKGVKINAANITVDAGSKILSDGQGYKTNEGPGMVLDPNSYGGASYGGSGMGNIVASLYGSATKPIDLGSGGSSWQSAGGGAIQLIVSDVFENNGIISANGYATSSGGSIYVKSKNISGNGFFTANGGVMVCGNTCNGGGSGGRIALYFVASTFNGKVETKGGCGSYDGMTMVCAGNGTVGFFDTANNNLAVDTSWQFRKSDSPFNFNQIAFTKGANITTEKEVNITANNISMEEASVLTLSGGEIFNVDNLHLKGSSIISVIPESILALTISNIIIDFGSKILAEAKGYLSGPGTPNVFYEAGASYGGKGGGNTAKPAYGSDIAPVDFGSGTESHRGGGAIRLVVSNNFKNDGIISANSTFERVSGGSIYVTANHFSGNGVFLADGGNSSWPYDSIAGSGGRISIYYQDSSWSGFVSAAGGKYCYSGCAKSAEDGTVKMIDTSIPPPAPPDPTPDTTPPTILNYKFNGNEGDVTINPVVNSLSLVFTSSENVNWMSIKIEKENDASVYKIFQSGAGCVDGTDICTKNWDGLLSSGGLIENQNGVYRIKIHIKDPASNEFYDYLAPYKIIVNTSI